MTDITYDKITFGKFLLSVFISSLIILAVVTVEYCPQERVVDIVENFYIAWFVFMCVGLIGCLIPNTNKKLPTYSPLMNTIFQTISFMVWIVFLVHGWWSSVIVWAALMMLTIVLRSERIAKKRLDLKLVKENDK